MSTGVVLYAVCVKELSVVLSSLNVLLVSVLMTLDVCEMDCT